MRETRPSQCLAAWPRSRSRACGEEDFTNEPARASAAINVAAKIDQGEVVVSPERFGAGQVTFTIANFSDVPVRFTLSGPKDAASPEIPPGAPAGAAPTSPSEAPTSSVTPTAATLKVELPEGSYEASAGEEASAQPDTIQVGPPRESSRDELLLP